MEQTKPGTPLDTRVELIGQSLNYIREVLISKAVSEHTYSTEAICNEAASVLQNSQWGRNFFLSTAMINGWSEQEIFADISRRCGGDYHTMETLKKDFPLAQEYRVIREKADANIAALNALNSIGQDAVN